MPRALSLNVVGVAHANKNGGNRRSEILFCDPGEPIDLRPDPKNPADPQAVAVFTVRGFQIGYLTAERAPWIGKLLSEGRELEAIFQAAAPWGAIVRVGIDGASPLPLPVPIEKATEGRQGDAGEPDFYPDEIPPDE